MILRSLSAMAGTLTIPAVYLLARRLLHKEFDEREHLALASAAILALHPFAIAFSRVAFVDTLQTLLIVVAIYLSKAPAARGQRSVFRLAAISLLWAFAFLVKFNAPIVAASWYLAMAIVERQTLKKAAVELCSIALCISLLVAPWAADILPWMGSFLARGGSYEMSVALSFFLLHSSKPFAGILLPLLILGSALSAYHAGEKKDRTSLTLSLTVVFYLTAIIVAGRTFQRYLVVCTPFMAILLPRVLHSLRARGQQSNDRVIYRTMQLVAILMIAATATEFGGLTSSYWGYLHNDVDIQQLSHDVNELRTSGAKVFWMPSEPHTAYYSGFSQLYSRASRPWVGPEIGYSTYAEGMRVPYAVDTLGYGVKVAQHELHQNGVLGLFSGETRQHIALEAQSVKDRRAKLSGSDYLSDTVVHSGDLVVLLWGAMDLNGEPALDPIDSSAWQVKSIPIDRFNVLKAYRASGESSVTDTTLTPYTMGGWILQKR